MNKARIAFIGCGNMGRSLIGGLIANGHPPELICAADPDAAQRGQVAGLFRVAVHEDNAEALKDADVVVLAVKPQHVNGTVRGIADKLEEQGPLLISIAAGVRLSAISRSAGKNIPLVRVMPNTPALIQAGAAALYANSAVNTAQRELAETIMRSVGITLWLDEESKLDTVTALSGSGPAYFFLVMEAMETAAVNLGLERGQARLLTLETALGAARMAMESTHDPSVLRQQVTSPGGTTEQALKVLIDGELAGLFETALGAAKNRAAELANEFENS